MDSSDELRHVESTMNNRYPHNMAVFEPVWINYRGNQLCNGCYEDNEHGRGSKSFVGGLRVTLETVRETINHLQKYASLDPPPLATVVPRSLPRNGDGNPSLLVSLYGVEILSLDRLCAFMYKGRPLCIPGICADMSQNWTPSGLLALSLDTWTCRPQDLAFDPARELSQTSLSSFLQLFGRFRGRKSGQLVEVCAQRRGWS